MDMMAHEVTISSWSPCTEKVQLSFHRMTYDHRDDHSHHRFCTTGTVHERTSFAVSTYPTRRYCKDLTSQCRYSCSIRTSLFHTTVCIIQSRQRSLRRSESLIRKQSHGLVFVRSHVVAATLGSCFSFAFLKLPAVQLKKFPSFTLRTVI